MKLTNFMKTKKEYFIMNKNTRKMLYETFLYIDYTLFKDEPKKLLKETEYKEYLSVKSSFIHNLFELYNLVGYEKEDLPFSNKNELIDHVEETVTINSENFYESLENENNIEFIRESYTEAQKENKNIDLQLFIEKAHKNLMLDTLIDRVYFSEDITSNYKFKLLTNSYSYFKSKLLDYVR